MSENNRYQPDWRTGLSSEQVDERIREGLDNSCDSNKTKSYGQILKEHFFTFFNILNIVLAALLISVGAYKDLAFIVIVLVNFVIGVIQEFSSKRTLDKLALIVAAKVYVVRDGEDKTISIEDIVLDDVIKLKSGNQICADAIVLEGYLEVNESLISGESDVIVKKEGDFLYSGSFVVSGSAYARVEHVGEDNYANRISMSAKTAKKRKSELYSTLGSILRFISYIIVPLGIMLFYKQNIILDLIPEDAVVKTVAALIGMIPEGLILMTSIAFVASTIFLASDHTLVQDIYGIETLARVDIICLDKTGTLTEGRLDFDELIPIEDVDFDFLLSEFCGASEDENSTITALRNKYGSSRGMKIKSTIPFSSDRKYSGVSYEEKGTYILGAAEFIFPYSHEDLKKEAQALSSGGVRVIMLAHSDAYPQNNKLPGALKPLAFIKLSDKIRPDSKVTLDYFAQYDVDIRIISGDNPGTVAYVAKNAGVRGAENYIDASTLLTEDDLKDAISKYSVFGRVSPQQKKDIIALMKADGHKVAMMGDGVNDVLALKEADCSIAVSSGSDAAKNISDIVLMDSNPKHLLHVVEDGRKIINNIQRVATLFITKTVYSVLLAFATLFLFESAYPFTPLQLVITSFVTIGAPSFFLALEPQYDRVKGRFIKNVLEKSLPGGIGITLCIIAVNWMAGVLDCTQDQLTAICVYVVVAGGMWVLLKVSLPWTWIRKTVFIGMIGLFALCVALFHDFFEIAPITPAQIVFTILLCAAMFFLFILLERFMQYIYKVIAIKKRKPKRRKNRRKIVRKDI